jgi:hypothetical protein
MDNIQVLVANLTILINNYFVIVIR